MIKKIFGITILFLIYIYFVSTEGEGIFFIKAKKIIVNYYKKVKEMKLKVEVNKFSNKD